MRRLSERSNAHAQAANFIPKVIGSAWMPCVRPTHSVSWYSNALALQMRTSRFTSSMTRSIDCVICTMSAVSPRSELVMP